MPFPPYRREGIAERNADMYNNNAALTMPDYFSGSALLFLAFLDCKDIGVKREEKVYDLQKISGY